MRQGKLGKIFVKFCDTIDLDTYMDKHSSLSQKEMELKLTRDLYQIHKQEIPITMNSLVVSSMIYHPEN